MPDSLLQIAHCDSEPTPGNHSRRSSDAGASWTPLESASFRRKQKSRRPLYASCWSDGNIGSIPAGAPGQQAHRQPHPAQHRHNRDHATDRRRGASGAPVTPVVHYARWPIASPSPPLLTAELSRCATCGRPGWHRPETLRPAVPPRLTARQGGAGRFPRKRRPAPPLTARQRRGPRWWRRWRGAVPAACRCRTARAPGRRSR